MKGYDNSKIHISSNFILSISLLIMFDTLLLRSSLHCNTPLHFTILHHTSRNYTSLHFATLHYTYRHFTTLRYTSLHLPTLHYTYRHFTSSHLHFTTLSYTSLLLSEWWSAPSRVYVCVCVCPSHLQWPSFPTITSQGAEVHLSRSCTERPKYLPT